MKLTSLVAALLLGLLAFPAHGAPTRGTLLAFPVVQPATAVVFSGLDLRGSGEVTTFDVTAKGGNVDCVVFNDAGGPVAKDEGPANACRIQVRPQKAGKFKLLVTNVGDAEAKAKATVIIQ
jgi:hypothetical protein